MALLKLLVKIRKKLKRSEKVAEVPEIDKEYFLSDEGFAYSSLESFIFIYELATKRLDVSNAVYDIMTNRMISLLKLVIPVTTALFVFMLNNWSYLEESALSISAVISLILLSLSGFLLSLGFFTEKVYSSGEYPYNLLDHDYFDPKDLKSKELHKNLVLNQILNYNVALIANKELNERRALAFDFALKLVLCVPFTLVLKLFF